MGRGDRRTKRGKLFRGTYGKSRPRKLLNEKNKTKKSEKSEPKAESAQPTA